MPDDTPERYLVSHCPVDETVETQAFRRKGLAFAYAKRKLPKNCTSAIGVEHQLGGCATPASIQDPVTGEFWTTINRWTFHLNGDIEHTRL